MPTTSACIFLSYHARSVDLDGCKRVYLKCTYASSRKEGREPITELSFYRMPTKDHNQVVLLHL